MPGYLASFLFIDSWGRKPIQLMGFTALSILFLLMGTVHRRTFSPKLIDRRRLRISGIHSVQRKSEASDVSLLSREFFSELWSERHNFHYTWGSFPY